MAYDTVCQLSICREQLQANYIVNKIFVIFIIDNKSTMLKTRPDLFFLLSLSGKFGNLCFSVCLVYLNDSFCASACNASEQIDIFRLWEGRGAHCTPKCPTDTSGYFAA